MVFISEYLSDAELRQQLSTYVKLLDGQEKALQQREAVMRQQAEVLAKREADLDAKAKLGAQNGQVGVMGVVHCGGMTEWSQFQNPLPVPTLTEKKKADGAVGTADEAGQGGKKPKADVGKKTGGRKASSMPPPPLPIATHAPLTRKMNFRELQEEKARKQVQAEPVSVKQMLSSDGSEGSIRFQSSSLSSVEEDLVASRPEPRATPARSVGSTGQVGQKSGKGVVKTRGKGKKNVVVGAVCLPTIHPSPHHHSLHRPFQLSPKKRTRTPSAFDLYCKEHRDQICTEAKQLGIGHKTQASRQWAQLEDKSKWLAMVDTPQSRTNKMK